MANKNDGHGWNTTVIAIETHEGQTSISAAGKLVKICSIIIILPKN